MKLESGRFKAGNRVTVSIHGKKYTRTVRDDQGKPYITIDGEKAYEDALSNYRGGAYDKSTYDHEYVRQHNDRVGLTIPKGDKDVWKQYAADLGMSMNAFVIYCVEREIHGQ